MKTIKYFCLLAAFALSFQFAQAQKAKKTVETTFKVSGICGMCEERIENALSVKGVKLAEWDVKTKECRVVYKSSVVTEEQLHELLNEAGHDTETSKASDEEYDQVHGCCKYRTMGDCDPNE